MRVDLKELLDKLGVGYVLTPYETCPWSSSDAEKGVTCSAEVRMNNDGNEIEAELQMMYDSPEEGKPPVEQEIWIFCKPITGDKWSTTEFRIHGKDEVGCVYEWESKACNFFAACVQEVKMGNIPDIDAIMEKELSEHERFGGSRGGRSSKAPKIKPQALLGLKNGRGF